MLEEITKSNFCYLIFNLSPYEFTRISSAVARWHGTEFHIQVPTWYAFNGTTMR